MLPFRLVRITVGAVLEVLREILLLPARTCGYRDIRTTTFGGHLRAAATGRDGGAILTGMKDPVAYLNRNRGGFNETLGLSFSSATDSEVVASLEVEAHHLQPYGIVHGGVYCAMVETVASTGAALSAMGRGQHVVGLENTTSFVRAVRTGTLRARGTPITRGRSSQLWQVEVRDEDDQIVATGRVRLLCLAGDAQIAGKGVSVKSRGDG